uniref:HTH cro/C1-type domain-containing protein n=1 Tax=uncultured bacterium contig00032 TaxID=1181521 RepID=A0A806KJR0_9BACT|nr:hypothetical protein [uncultured bacterium contig00032]
MNGADLRRILSINIKLLRRQRSLSQMELAEKADISIPFLSNIERSNKWPHPDTLVRLANALDVDVFVLFQEKTAPLSNDTQETLIKYKKAIRVSLHKMVAKSIDSSLEAIGSQYLDAKPQREVRKIRKEDLGELLASEPFLQNKRKNPKNSPRNHHQNHTKQENDDERG